MPITAPGSHSVTRIRSMVVSGPTRVRQSNSVPTPRRWSVTNSIDSASAIQSRVRGDVLDRRPDAIDRRADRGAEVDVHHAPLRTAAACSGATELAKIPLPSSKPATTLVRGTISTCQCISRVGMPGGAVCTRTLYGAPGSAGDRGRARRACPRATTAISASVASSIRARVDRCATRSWYGDHDAGGHQAGRGPVDHHEIGAAGDRELGRDEVGGEPLGHRRRPPRHGRSGATICACGMLDRRAGTATVVHEGGGERPPLLEMEAHPVAEHEEQLGRLVVVERGEVAVVIGAEDHHLVRAGRVAGLGGTDDGVEVRDDPHPPARRVRRAVTRATGLGRGLVLVTRTERTRRRVRSAGRLSPRSCTGGRRGRRRR